MAELFRKSGHSLIANSALVVGAVELGPGVNIWFQSVVRGDLAKITFSSRVNLQDACVVHTDFDAPMFIDEGVVVGHGAILHGNRIGRDTLIGIGARLLSGSVIGDECLIAAGSLIVPGQEIPPRSVVMGSPGKIVRNISDADLALTRKISSRYWELAQRYASGNDQLLRPLQALETCGPFAYVIVMNEEPTAVVTVLGLGTMGHGIVQAFASKGIQVHGYDESRHAREELIKRVRTNLIEFARFGLHPADQIDAALERITVHDSLEAACRPATFVVEAVREDLQVKQELLAEVESHVAAYAILASNSSSFPISQSGSRLRCPQRALVTHWFNPPHIVPTVEIVPSPFTSETATQTALALHRQIGKSAIVIRRELPGFLVNRVQVAVMREVWDLLERGVASPEDIDTAIQGSMGFRLAAFGPLRIHDFGGLDIQAAVYRNLCPQIRSDVTLPAIVDDKVAAGHFGFKTGEGFYTYPPDQADRVLAERDERYLALLKLLHTGEQKVTG